MAISYPLTPPTNVSPARFELVEKYNQKVERSPFSSKQQVQDFAGDQWILQVTYPLMTPAQAAEWTSFFSRLRGAYGTFLMGNHLKTSISGSGGGAPRVNGSGQTGTILASDGWPTSTSGVLLEDDLIQIDNSLYRVLQDVDSDGSGEADIDVFPSLRSHSDNTSIETSNCVGIWRMLNTNVRSYSVNLNKNLAFSFEAEEAL